MRHLVMRQPAEALVQRLSGRLAEQVPQRDIHRGSGAHLYSGAGKTEILVLQGPSMPVHLQGRLPEQQRCHRFMDVRLDRARTEEGLAQTDQSFIRMNVKPEQVGELAVV